MVTTNKKDEEDIDVASPTKTVPWVDDQVSSTSDLDQGTLLKPDTKRNPKVFHMNEPLKRCLQFQCEKTFQNP